MKNYTGFLILLVVCLTGCAGNKNKDDKVITPVSEVVKVPQAPAVIPRQTDLKEEKLAGKVKYIKYRTYAILDRPGEPEKGGLEGMREYEYDELGNIVTQTEGRIGEQHKLVCKYKYDAKGNRIEKDLLMPGVSDSVGLVKKTEYVYDTAGNMVKQTLSNGGDEIDEIVLNKYDKNGNLIEQERFNGHGMERRKETYKWANGVIVKTISFSGEVKLSIYGCLYKYDKYMNEIECNDEGLITKTKYVYDSAGNWITKVSRNYLSGYIEEREIGYYP